jgi:hypothetical protein
MPQMMRIALRMRVVEFVDPATGKAAAPGGGR